jgi:hypothetical protein
VTCAHFGPRTAQSSPAFRRQSAKAAADDGRLGTAPPNDHLVIMPLTADQRHALLLADRSRDVGQITVVIEHVFAANSDANLFDIELAFRDAACAAYVIAGPSKALHVVTGGLSAMLAALTAAERSSLENRASAGSLINK